MGANLGYQLDVKPASTEPQLIPILLRQSLGLFKTWPIFAQNIYHESTSLIDQSHNFGMIRYQVLDQGYFSACSISFQQLLNCKGQIYAFNIRI